MTLLLDTHVLVWLVQGDARLSHTTQTRIEQAAAEGDLWVSAITPWEIGMLVAKGRLVLARDVQSWVDEVLALPGLRLAPLLPALAVASSRLPGDMRGDPADRIIVATARHLGACLMTADRALLQYAAAGHLQAAQAD